MQTLEGHDNCIFLGNSAYIKKKLASSDPLMICRLGAEESRTAVRWMKNVPYEQRNIHNIMYNAGVFPNDKETIDEFCKIYTGALKDADGVFSWGCKGECSLIKKYAFYATSFDSIALTASCYSYHRLGDNEQPNKGIQLMWCILLILLPIALLFAESSMKNLQSGLRYLGCKSNRERVRT